MRSPTGWPASHASVRGSPWERLTAAVRGFPGRRTAMRAALDRGGQGTPGSRSRARAPAPTTPAHARRRTGA